MYQSFVSKLITGLPCLDFNVDVLYQTSNSNQNMAQESFPQDVTLIEFAVVKSQCQAKKMVETHDLIVAS